jgi:hypothetical protein
MASPRPHAPVSHGGLDRGRDGRCVRAKLPLIVGPSRVPFSSHFFTWRRCWARIGPRRDFSLSLLLERCLLSTASECERWYCQRLSARLLIALWRVYSFLLAYHCGAITSLVNKTPAHAGERLSPSAGEYRILVAPRSSKSQLLPPSAKDGVRFRSSSPCAPINRTVAPSSAPP